MKTRGLTMLSGAASGFAAAMGSAAIALYASPAVAGLGQPSPGQTGMQEPASPVAEQILWFHNNWVNPIIIAIAVFVMLLMLYVMFAFSAKRNPTPTKTTHNTMLEVAWTVIPILILIAIGIPSFRLLFLQYSYPKADLTIKATGNAWFWEHQYPDNGGFTVSSNMLKDEDLLKEELGADAFNKQFSSIPDGLPKLKAMYEAAGPLWDKTKRVRQLSVTNDIAVPLNKVVHLLITSNDVIHSWTIPSFGSKMQAVPGRITTTWFKPTKEGVFYGQCSVLCGKEHSGMPITVRVVPEAVFADWTAAVKARDLKKARAILQAATDDLEKRKLAETQTTSGAKLAQAAPTADAAHK